MDAEFDQHLGGPKLLAGKEVRPDIVVHGRHHDRSNLLVVEMKKGANPDDKDIEHLIGFANPEGREGYRYDYGLFLGFERASDGKIVPTMRWFEGKVSGDPECR